eukprot:237864-Pyramimonas_sp.AAC.1
MQDMFVLRDKEVRIGSLAKTPTHDELARRLAITHEQTTIWDPGVAGIAIEMCGDIWTVVQWLRGGWACHNSGYAKRIARFQIIMCDMCEQHNARCPTYGKDFWKHIYIEADACKDELTHHAREGNCYIIYKHDYIKQNKTNITYIRGCWDGGVSSEGAAGCHWIEVAPENGPWTLVCAEVYMFDVGSTVTEAELSAAERLCTGVEHIVKEISSARRRRRT